MKFGLFYEHQLPRPWEEIDEHQLLKNALEQVSFADKLGFDYVWEVEHHFLEEYSHSSAPEVFLSACSQLTKDIRLGHGIVQLPVEFNHPARVAERIATLDLISDGRVEFGTGESSSEAELGGFRVNRDTKRNSWREALDAITKMFVEEPFAGYDGEFLKMPPRNVVPKPFQKPHPPIWVACSRRETILLAAELGIGALTFSFIEPGAAKEWVDEYEKILFSPKCVPAGFNVNPQIACVLPLMCHHDEEVAIERGLDGCHFFGYSLAHYYVFGQHQPGKTNIYNEFLQNRSKFGFDRAIASKTDVVLGAQLIENGLGSLRGAIGTPAQIRQLVTSYEEAGVDQLIFVSQAGKNKHEDVMESLELFSKEVMPEFKERDEESSKKKAERLSPAIEAALSRRDQPRVLDPDYAIPTVFKI